MLLEIKFFTLNDFFLVPLCLIIMFAIVRTKANLCKDEKLRKYYYQAFYFKILYVFIYTIVTEFYFGGGDTALYYQAIQDLRAALSDDFNYLQSVATTSELTVNHPLAPYFLYDNYANDFTFNYMQGASNFFVPRLGLLPSLAFFNSYLCICLCFSMFALGGTLRRKQ